MAKQTTEADATTPVVLTEEKKKFYKIKHKANNIQNVISDTGLQNLRNVAKSLGREMDVLVLGEVSGPSQE